MTRIVMNVPDDLDHWVVRYAQTQGYASASEAYRHIIRQFVAANGGLESEAKN